MSVSIIPVKGGAVAYPDFASFPPASGSSSFAWDEATNTLYYDEPASVAWEQVGGGSGGEINTGSNYGTSGVGVYDSKSGVVLRFRNINPLSSKLSAVLNNTSHTVDMDVEQANLSLSSIGGTLNLSQIQTVTADRVLGSSGSGVIEAISSLARNGLNGLDQTISITPADIGGSIFANNDTFTITPTANITQDYWHRYSITTLDGSFDVSNIRDVQFGVTKNGSGDVGQIFSVDNQLNLGDGTAATTNNINAYNGYIQINDNLTTGQIYSVNAPITVQALATVDSIFTLNGNPNIYGTVTNGINGFNWNPTFQSGSSVSNSTLIYSNPQVDSTISYFAGVGINGYGTASPTSTTGFYYTPSYSGTVTNFTGFQAGYNGSTVTNFQGVNIGTGANGDGFVGFNLTTNNITLSSYFNGISINPIIASVPNATGLQVNMGSVTGTNVKAADLVGDVSITGSLSFSGALSIGQLLAYAPLTVVSGSGNPASVHSLVSAPNIPANATITLGDTIGVNTAALITVGANSTTTTALVGLAALALPAVVQTHTASTVDLITGATFAISLDGSSTGGTIDVVSLCRSVAIPNGITTINKLRGYDFQLPFGDPGTETWGLYAQPDSFNWMKGSLKIGGTAGSTDKVSNSSTGLELEGKALRLANLTGVQIAALTPLAGMMVFNTTTSKAQCYDGAAWQDLF